MSILEESLKVATKEKPFVGHWPTWPLHYEARPILLSLLPAFFWGTADSLVGGPFSTKPKQWQKVLKKI